MYYISKRLVISASHHLELSYPSKCSQLHGHNWTITVYCKARELNKDGMVIDFKLIKQKIESQLDHANLNEVLPCSREHCQVDMRPVAPVLPRRCPGERRKHGNVRRE